MLLWIKSKETIGIEVIIKENAGEILAARSAFNVKACTKAYNSRGNGFEKSYRLLFRVGVGKGDFRRRFIGSYYK